MNGSQKTYPRPGESGCPVTFKAQYENFIGGKWVPPVKGQYFDNVSPVNGKVFCKSARSTAEDIELALDAAHAAKDKFGAMTFEQRAKLMNKMADAIEQNLEKLAVAEVWDNGKPIREALAADIPLAADHLRYFASAIRTQEGFIAEHKENTVAYHFHEPLGVVGAIIPWNFPILMAIWKLSPALAGGNCIIIKPAEQTPASIMILMEIWADIVPPGVINVVTGYGPEAGKPLACSPRIAKIAFTGETSTGQLIMQYASQNIIPVTLELGGKSPNIFFADIANENDEFFEKAVEGCVMFVLNQGEVCTCPSRALVHESIYDKFIEKVVQRLGKVKQGDPLNLETMVGAQVSTEQMDKILHYVELGKKEGAQCIVGGSGKKAIGGDLEGGYYIEPTIFKGDNKMRIFQEEIFGPVLSVTTFRTEEEAIQIANDTSYGLGAGLWTRDIMKAYRVSRAIKAGRVWVNCYHEYPSHAAFGGYKKSGFGRECHKLTLEHYQQLKNIIISYSPQPTGLF
jgi:aldehyde dehydrogenase